MLRSPIRSCCQRRGVVAVMVALCLTILVGIIAVTMDGGIMQAERRHAQAVADAAALAGASELFLNVTSQAGLDPSGTALASARAVAAGNGYNHGSNATVVVNIPPTNGSAYGFMGDPFFVGRAAYVEVIVEFNQPRAFSNIWGGGNIPVRARAVAQGGWRYIPAIVVLDSSANGAFRINNGTGTIRVLQGAVVVNSTASNAAYHQTETDFIAPEYQITGNYQEIDQGRFLMTQGGSIPSSSTGRPPLPDPLSFLPVPDPTSLPTRQVPSPTIGPNGEQIFDLQPGRYTGGIQILEEMGITKIVNMAPGMYYMDGGGFRFTSNLGSLTGNGVTIYNAPTAPFDFLTISGQGRVTLSAPTSGPYSNITIFQDRSANQQVTLDSRGNFDITGGIYAAGALVFIRRNDPDIHIGSQFVSRRLTITGSGNLEIPGFELRTRTIRLVE